MWTSDQITIVLGEIEDSEPPIAIIVITVPVGVIELLGAVWFDEQTLHIHDAHVGGLSAGACGRAGLNAIGRKLMEVANVREIIIQGSTRTTGKYKNKVPRAIRFPRD